MFPQNILHVENLYHGLISLHGKTKEIRDRTTSLKANLLNATIFSIIFSSLYLCLFEKVMAISNNTYCILENNSFVPTIG